MAGRGGILLCEISSDLVGSVFYFFTPRPCFTLKINYFVNLPPRLLSGSPPYNGTLVVQGGMEAGGVKGILFPD